MALIEWYPQLRHAHMALAALSVTLFVARGLGVLLQAAWPMTAAARSLSVGIDTLLLGAGVTLWWLLGLNPGRDTWLLAKLVLIVAYIVVGSVALKRARSGALKGVAFVVSLACIAAVFWIARRHDAWAPLRLLGGG